MLNQCNFIGNLGKDPEIRATKSGEKVASFSLAVTQTWRDKQSGERREKTEWVSISVFNQNLVKVVEQYLKKGSKCFVSGSFQTRKWQDQSGNDRYTTEIVLQNFNGTIELLDGKRNSGGSDDHGDAREDDRGSSKPAENKASGKYDFDDTIPF